jgi:hypothetical protein
MCTTLPSAHSSEVGRLRRCRAENTPGPGAEHLRIEFGSLLSPPVGSISACPRTSSIREASDRSTPDRRRQCQLVGCAGHHGTLLRCVKSCPPTSIITVSGSYRNETGTACGCPSAEVAIRGRHWDSRWAVSAGVRTMAHPHTTTTYRQRIGVLAQLGLEFHGGSACCRSAVALSV